MRKAILATDLIALYHHDPHAAILATMSTAQHASRLGADVLDHIRGQLIALASAMNKIQPSS
jgi:hypothetical protein